MKKWFFVFVLAGTCLLATHVQAQTVYASAKGEKYHTADCRLSGDADAVTLAKARKDKKTACAVCKPDEWVKKKLAQCEGKTKDGTRCKRHTGNTNKKCFQHQ
jgi:hypothetical protein